MSCRHHGHNPTYFTSNHYIVSDVRDASEQKQRREGTSITHQHTWTVVMPHEHGTTLPENTSTSKSQQPDKAHST